MWENFDLGGYLMGAAEKGLDLGLAKLDNKVSAEKAKKPTDAAAVDQRAQITNQAMPLSATGRRTDTKPPAPLADAQGGAIDTLRQLQTPLMIAGLVLTGFLVYRLVK